jgi:hypothetical protein
VIYLPHLTLWLVATKDTVRRLILLLFLLPCKTILTSPSLAAALHQDLLSLELSRHEVLDGFLDDNNGMVVLLFFWRYS